RRSSRRTARSAPVRDRPETTPRTPGGGLRSSQGQDCADAEISASRLPCWSPSSYDPLPPQELTARTRCQNPLPGGGTSRSSVKPLTSFPRQPVVLEVKSPI